MSLLLGKPNKSIIHDILTRGKLVIYLTNGSFVTFTKEEVGTTLQMEGNWESSISREPYKSKILAACGSNSNNVIKKIIDRGMFIKSVNGMHNFNNMTSIRLDACTYLGTWAFGGSSGTHCTEFYFPNLTGCDHGVFDRNKFVKKILISKDLSWWAYNFASDCPELEEVNMPNLTEINGWNLTKMFHNDKNLKRLSWPKLTRFDVYSGSYIGLSEYIEELDLPKLVSSNMNNNALAHMVSMKKANLISLTKAYVQSRKSWGLPVGCEIFCKDGSYIVS